MEEWADVPGYEGFYRVSTLGRVESLRHKRTSKPGILKGSVSTQGYVRVELWRDKHPKVISVHRLVAKTFIPNPDNLPQVNHIDGDKANNRVENLEWVTSKQNVNHYWRQLQGKPYKLTTGRDNKWRSKKVRCVETGEVFESIKAAAASVGVSERAISRLIKGDPHRFTSGGYHWELANSV